MDSTTAGKLIEDATKGPYGLTEGEKWWKDRYVLLKEHGYELRPRLRPGWTPSWVRRKKNPFLCEDGIPSAHPKVMDAIRVSDKAQVAIKMLERGSDEVDIVRYLNSEDLRSDLRNHTVPVLDVFSDRGDSTEFLVMPLLNRFNAPLFSSVDEVVDFMTQTLEGLSFMHSKGVAHRDCSILNIMMDGKSLFPRGSHPSAYALDVSGERLAHPRKRRDVPGIKYYFTDFGLSSRFDDSSTSHLVTGEHCQDKALPELDFDEPYDPFPVDVFLLGNVFRRTLIAAYENLECFVPLSNAMTQANPKARPTPDEALRLLNDIVKKQSPRSLRRFLILRDADMIGRFFSNAGSFRREAALVLKSYLPFFGKK